MVKQPMSCAEILRIRIKIIWLQARVLVLRIGLRLNLLIEVLRLAPNVTYVSYHPLIPAKLLRDLAKERGEDPSSFLRRAHRYPREVEKELGSTFEEIAIKRSYVATTTLRVERDYEAAYLRRWPNRSRRDR